MSIPVPLSNTSQESERGHVIVLHSRDGLPGIDALDSEVSPFAQPMVDHA